MGAEDVSDLVHGVPTTQEKSGLPLESRELFICERHPSPDGGFWGGDCWCGGEGFGFGVGEIAGEGLEDVVAGGGEKGGEGGEAALEDFPEIGDEVFGVYAVEAVAVDGDFGGPPVGVIGG